MQNIKKASQFRLVFFLYKENHASNATHRYCKADKKEYEQIGVVLIGENRILLNSTKNQHRICKYKCTWAVAQTH